MDGLLRDGLPPLPARMTHLPVDARGYPIPWFVKWYGEKPDFRVADGAKFRDAIRFNYCWVCGESLGSYKTFVLSALNTMSRSTTEPACHFDCAYFAVRACPWILNPQARRRDKAALPAGANMPPGVFLGENPGIAACWTTRRFRSIPMTDGRRLLSVGDAVAVKWFVQGEPASRAQIEAALEEALPKLYKIARLESIDQTIKLENAYAQVVALLPVE